MLARDADALFCAGDLYEHDRVTPDTGRFLQATFTELAPCPVYLAPGNHDWYGPDSLYALVEWSPNVHVFRKPQLEPVSVKGGPKLDQSGGVKLDHPAARWRV